MELVGMLLILYFTLVWAIIAIYVGYSLLFSTPFYPSKLSSLEESMRALGLENGKGKKFVDLGCGEGRVVQWAAKHGYSATGIELNPLLSIISRFRLFLTTGKYKTKIVNKSFYQADLREFDIIYVYLYPEHMDKLIQKLKKELKKDAVVVSNTFVFKNLKPIKEFERFRVYKIVNLND